MGQIISVNPVYIIYYPYLWGHPVHDLRAKIINCINCFQGCDKRFFKEVLQLSYVQVISFMHNKLDKAMPFQNFCKKIKNILGAI